MGLEYLSDKQRQAREIFAQALTGNCFWTLHYTETNPVWQDLLAEIKKCLFFVLMAVLMDGDYQVKRAAFS